jgi:plastocyanin
MLTVRLLPLVILSAVLFIASACGDDDEESSSRAVTVATITQRDFAFDPDNVTLLDFLSIRSSGFKRQDQLKVINEGTVDHSFTINYFGVDEVVSPGSEKSIDLPADFTSLEFYCRFHETQGMTGRISVAGSATSTRR